MNVKMALAVAGVMLGVVSALPVEAQVRPELLVRQRQAAMVLMGKYFYPIRAQAQGKTPYDPSVVARNVAYVDALARMPWDGFVASTREVKSQSTPAVFNDTAKFKEAQDRFVAEVTRLSELTRKGDESAIRAQILAVDKSCLACHENFRERQ